MTTTSDSYYIQPSDQREPARYGGCYYIARLKGGSEVAVVADSYKVMEGAVHFVGALRRESDEDSNPKHDGDLGPEVTYLTLAAGTWDSVYAASRVDTSPVVVDWWQA